MIARFIWGQFRKPSGVFGRLIGSAMARGNEHEARWTISLLPIRPSSRVLEVGFGPGLALQFASEKACQGLVAGIDSSATMVQAARKRNATAVAAGVVDVRQGDVASLPYPDESFDMAFAIHCIYLWAQPPACLKELRRVLKPGGLLAITIHPRDIWEKARMPPADMFTLYNANEVAQMLSHAGFREVRVESCPQPDKFPGDCILGARSLSALVPPPNNRATTLHGQFS